MNGVQIIRTVLVGTCVCCVFFTATQFEKATAKENEVRHVAVVHEYTPSPAPARAAVSLAEPETAPVSKAAPVTTPEPTQQSTDTQQAVADVPEPSPAPIIPEPIIEVPAPELREFLSLHNDVRSDLDLPPLTWSSNLALKAQNWADTLADDHACELIHSNEPYGENLFSLWSSDGSIQGTPDDAMDWWTDEATYYDYDSNTCEAGEVCGHYTQIIWETTTAVGCAVATCSDRKGSTDLFVCKYSPQGNIIGKRPY